MHPNIRQNPQDETVTSVTTAEGDYPVDRRMRQQMIERAKADGINYQDVHVRMRKIIEPHGLESDVTEAEIEVYLGSRRHAPTERTGPRRTRPSPRSAIEVVTR